MVLVDTGYWIALVSLRNFDAYRWKDAEPFHNLLRASTESDAS